MSLNWQGGLENRGYIVCVCVLLSVCVCVYARVHLCVCGVVLLELVSCGENKVEIFHLVVSSCNFLFVPVTSWLVPHPVHYDVGSTEKLQRLFLICSIALQPNSKADDSTLP